MKKHLICQDLSGDGRSWYVSMEVWLCVCVCVQGASKCISLALLSLSLSLTLYLNIVLSVSGPLGKVLHSLPIGEALCLGCSSLLR